MDRDDYAWTNPPETRDDSEPDWDKMNDDIWIHERQQGEQE